jgi:membrane protein implicated in regulation of membrane protease activity
VLWTVFLVKDFVLYPFLRRAYEDGSPAGTETLIGQVGIAKQPLAPEGLVLIGGELWRARVQGGQSVQPGDRVHVVGTADGFVLLVSPRRT